MRAGDGGAEVVVGGADLDDGGVVAVDLDGVGVPSLRCRPRLRIGWLRSSRILER